jgi:3-hydroxyacyl-CoA dehydrogenase
MDVRPTDSHWPRDLEPVAIIGAGGSGLALAELALHFGYPTRIVDTDKSKLKKVRDRVAGKLGDLKDKGLLHDDVDTFLEGLTTTSSLEEATDGAGLIVEALPEDLDLKRGAFEKLADMEGDPVIGTDTSLFSVSEVAEGNPAADRIVGTHFYGLGRQMPHVEIIRGSKTSDGTVERAEEFVRGIGKDYAIIGRDEPGFVTTRVLSRLFHRCAEAAEYEDVEPARIDAGFRELGFPRGPFQLMDENGLDRIELVAEHLDGEAPDRVSELVEEDKLGKKTGVGWYEGPPPRDVEPADPWPYLPSFVVEAARMVEEDFADAETVDRLLRLGAKCPGGPFQLVHEKGLDEMVELAEENDVDPEPLESIELPEETNGVEVHEAGDLTLIKFIQSHRGNDLTEEAEDAFASAVWEVDGPLIIASEGRYFLHPEQQRFPDETLDALRKTESVALLHGPLGDGAMSVGRACRRRVARVDAAIGVDRPVPATRAVQLELVDAVAHPLWLNKALKSVLSTVTDVSERSLDRLLENL